MQLTKLLHIFDDQAFSFIIFMDVLIVRRTFTSATVTLELITT